ncbi:MAG: 1-phosphofructokinase family hexose kinase [Desulfovibrionales bacterium]
MKTVCTLTMNPTIDKSSSIDHVVPERKLRCNAPTYEPGGGGINVSKAIRNLGGDAMAVFPAGGHAGEKLKELLEMGKIRHTHIGIQGWTRENLAIHETSTGQQYRFGMPGPTLKDEEWQRCLDEFFSLSPTPEYAVLSGSLPPGVPDDFYAKAAQKAKKAGIRMILDTSGKPLPEALQEGVFLIKPNLRELQSITGKEFENEEQQEQMARELVEKGKAEVVVVSLGAAGALAVWKGNTHRLRAPTVSIKSKVGAGDSMVAGMTLGFARDMSMLDAIRFGMACGAAAVMTPGSELCRKEDAERLYAQLSKNDLTER